MSMIFLTYDKDTLDAQYLPAYWPGVTVEETVAQWNARGRDYHARAKVEADIAYGDSDLQTLDLLLPIGEGAPILVFIHGGYWRNPQVNRTSCNFCVEPIVDAGALVAMIDYDLCPQVSLDTIVDQVRNACAWVWRNAESRGGNPSRIHVSGHSAGGHLAAMMAATDWSKVGEDLPADLVKSIIPISGLFELEPLRLSSLNADLRLDEEAASRNSPRFLKPLVRMPVSVFVGGAESDEFRRQSREFKDSWREHTGPVDCIEIPGKNHFTVIEAMTEPDNLLTGTILRHLWP